jgi:hypothetical protein
MNGEKNKDLELQKFYNIDGKQIMDEGEFALKVNEETLGKSKESLRRALRDAGIGRIEKDDNFGEALKRIAKYSSEEEKEKVRNLPEYKFYTQDLEDYKKGKMRETLESIMKREGRNIRGEKI